MSEHIVVVDCETTTRNKGDPFDPANRLCSVGILDNGRYTDFEIEYSSSPYSDKLCHIKDILERADVVVGFNLKFDLHWLRRYLGPINIRSFHDCQFGEYILSNQSVSYPGLEECCSRHSLGSKLDVVRTEYWDKGIDTPDVPYPILSEYLEQDVRLTEKLYRYQCEKFCRDEKLDTLFQLGCEDLRWLQEAEWNGLIYDKKSSIALADELSAERDGITCRLIQLHDCPYLDWDSSDHISLVLYGGTLYYSGRETYTKVLKAGPVQRERKVWLPWEFKGFIKPDPKIQNKELRKVSNKELEEINRKRVEERLKPLVRIYSVGEGILRNYSPKGAVKNTIRLLLRRAELTKLISTYYRGIPKLMDEHGWDLLHGKFNQVVARTGRLSSKEPNLQNFVGEIKPLFWSRYE